MTHKDSATRKSSRRQTTDLASSFPEVHGFAPSVKIQSRRLIRLVSRSVPVGPIPTASAEVGKPEGLTDRQAFTTLSIRCSARPEADAQSLRWRVSAPVRWARTAG